MGAGGSGEGILLAGRQDERDLVDTGCEDLFDDDPEGGLGFAVPVDQSLEGEGLLVAAGGGHDGFLDFHGVPGLIRLIGRRMGMKSG